LTLVTLQGLDVRFASILSSLALYICIYYICIGEAIGGSQYKEVLNIMLSRQHDQFLIAQTVVLEAEGEPYQGKLAVAYVIMNRAVRGRKTVSEVIYDPYDFSAYNTRGGRATALGNINDLHWRASERAAASAYFGLEKDPTKGATHYLNVELTKKIRSNGQLPLWVREMKELVTIGLHTFYRER